MTAKVKLLYNGGLKNERFLKAIKDADGDKKPNMFSCELSKNIFATIYYGWLVSEYGNEWGMNI